MTPKTLNFKTNHISQMRNLNHKEISIISKPREMGMTSFHLKPNDLLGSKQWQIRSKIEKGHSYERWRVSHPSHQTAILQIFDLNHHIPEITEAIALFKLEMQILAEINHQGIVKILDLVQDDVAWYRGNRIGDIQYIKRKKFNAWGLYDMSGNLWEWCMDIYDQRFDLSQNGGYLENQVACKNEDTRRVIRGGASWNEADCCTVEYHTACEAGDLESASTFRLVRTQKSEISNQKA